MATEALTSLTAPIVLARTGASDLQSVRKLNCWGSEIEDISIVRQMPNLEVCSVSVNDIMSLQDFQYCPNLQELYVRNNKIENLAEICYLKKLEKLRILWLADNPCEKHNNYRMTVLKNLPNLQKFDNAVVDEEELALAKDQGDELTLPDEETEDSQKPMPDVIENGGKGDIPGAIGIQTKDDLPKGDTPGAIGTQTKDDLPKGDTPGTIGIQTKDDLPKDPITLNWEETNKVQEQLGLKPLPTEEMGKPKFPPNSSTMEQNAYILEAVLILVNVLDKNSLEILKMAVKKRLDIL